jgi:hypothetical protein
LKTIKNLSLALIVTVGLIQLVQSTMTFILQNKKIEDIVRVNRAFNLFLVKVAMIF